MSETPRPRFTSIQTERLTLRRFRASDLPILIAYRADPEVARFQGWSALNEEDGLAFVVEQQAREPGDQGGGFQFAVALRESDQVVGDCYFTLLWDDPQQGELGYTLSRAAQGYGYATEAVTAVLGYAFGTLGLHRVIARVASANERSVALLERLGFRREGHLLHSYFCQNAWIDEYLYAMLRDEWIRHDQVTK